jgi:hypothetical protein
VSAVMSVKPLFSLFSRVSSKLLADWWIDVLLMLFIVGSILAMR